MKIIKKLAATLGIFLFLGIGSTLAQTDVMDRYLDVLNDIAGAIEGIDDEASARAAARVIAEANVELEEVSDIVETMGPAAQAAMFQTRGMEFIQVQQRMSNAMRAMIAHPEYFEIINAEMKNMPDIGG